MDKNMKPFFTNDWGIFNSFHLKLIAITCMFIDHLAAYVLLDYFNINYSSDFIMQLPIAPNYIYMIMRSIGRIAFPIYCFLIAQGLYYTKDAKKYLTRLLIFAFVSEIPFDLAGSKQIFAIGSFNVYFTLFFGLLAIAAIDKYKSDKWYETIIISLGSLALCGGICELLGTDYGYHGVFAIGFFYFLQRSRILSSLVVLPAFGFESHLPAVFLTGPIIFFYNGKQGPKLKYFFYTFYPVHLLILYFIRIYFVC